MPDVLPAFLAWISGRPLAAVAPLVNSSCRLLPNAVRISGWSHTMGGVMKRIAEATPGWPLKIQHMRHLCRFFHNQGYRRHLQRLLRDRGLDLDKKLKFFTASFAKWRYETVADVVCQLAELRDLCELHMHESLFPNIQERELLRDVLVACRDRSLWKWICASHAEVFKPLESCRRWGMKCACHYPPGLRPLAGHEECPLRSRRLKDAHAEIQRRRDYFLERARLFQAADEEGAGELTVALATSFRLAASDLDMRFQYLSRAPWCFSQCGSAAGAREFLNQVELVHVSGHDPLTRRLLDQHGPHLVALAAGGECPDPLAEAVRLFNLAPLDESPGEGYHRSTHSVRQRAPGATVHYIKQDLRLAENIQRCRQFIRTHGEPGKDVFCFEWRCWTRILQTSPATPFRRVKIKRKAAFDRIYRSDDMAAEDWSGTCSRSSPFPAPLPLKTTNARQVQLEYITSVLAPLQWFVVQRQSRAIGPDGAAVTETVRDCFQVLRLQSSRSRAHLMPTADSHLHPEALPVVAVNIQRCDVQEGDGEGSVFVHAAEDPQWVQPEAICSFTDFRRSAIRHRHAVGCVGRPGTIQLSSPEAARPQHPLTDERCPTWSILDELRKRGWKFAQGKCVHRSSDPAAMVMDGREAVRMELYYMVLLNLGVRLTQTSCIPSDQPQMFYRLLLDGKHVEPGLGDAQYKRIAAAEPLALPAPPVPEDPDDDDDVVVAGGHVPVIPKAPPRPPALAPAPPAAVVLEPPAPPALPGPPPAEDDLVVAGAAGCSGGKGPAGGRTRRSRRSWCPAPFGDGLVELEKPGRLLSTSLGAALSAAAGKYEHAVHRSYKNWICQCPRHDGCEKKRIVSDKSGGVLGALAYVMAWRDVELPEGASAKCHNQTKPSPAAVQHVLDTRQAELQECCDRRQSMSDDDMFVPVAAPVPRTDRQPPAECKTCEKPVHVGQAPWRGCKNQHHDCGAAVKQFVASLARPARTEVREQYDSLSPEDQQHCHKAVVTGGRGSEGIENGVNMVQTMYRVAEVRARNGSELLDRGEFIAFQMYRRGKTRNVAEMNWKKLEDSKKTVQDKGKTKVWVNLPKQILHDDVAGSRLAQDPRRFTVDPQSARCLMREGVQQTAAAAAAVGAPAVVHSDSDGSDELPKGGGSEDNDSDDAPSLSAASAAASRPAPGGRKGAASPAAAAAPATGGKRAAAAHEEAPKNGKKPRTPLKQKTSPALVPVADLPATANTPVELSNAKMSLRAAAAAQMATFKDGDVSKVAAMLKALAPYKEHPDVKCLGYSQANAALEGFSREIDEWTVPLDVDSKRKEFQTLSERLDTQLNTLAGYVEIADVISAQKKDEETAAKKSAKGHVDSVAAKLSRGGTPSGVSRVMAGVLCEHLKKPAESRSQTYSSAYPFEISWSEGESYENVFLLPRGIPAGSEPKHHWHVQLEQVLSTEAATLKEKSNAARKKVEDCQGTHANGTVQLGSELVWNPAGGDAGPFQVVPGVRPNLVTMQAGAYLCSRQAMPMAGCGMFMSVVEGTA
ncbi:unnamed protein product, partial [Prorocentrum cordatum]